jgi:hypothetical protein
MLTSISPRPTPLRRKLLRRPLQTTLRYNAYSLLFTAWLPPCLIGTCQLATALPKVAINLM